MNPTWHQHMKLCASCVRAVHEHYLSPTFLLCQKLTWKTGARLTWINNIMKINKKWNQTWFLWWDLSSSETNRRFNKERCRWIIDCSCTSRFNGIIYVSSSATLSYGVPQGSGLAPVLFELYLLSSAPFISTLSGWYLIVNVFSKYIYP